MAFQINTNKVIPIILVLMCILLSTSHGHAELKLESVYPTLGVIGQELEAALTGTGFDEDTRVSMALDAELCKRLLS